MGEILRGLKGKWVDRLGRRGGPMEWAGRGV